jgi:hypothetical protein
MDQPSTMAEITYYGDWVLINAYFYKFWMPRKEFERYTFN